MGGGGGGGGGVVIKFCKGVWGGGGESGGKGNGYIFRGSTSTIFV